MGKRIPVLVALLAVATVVCLRVLAQPDSWRPRLPYVPLTPHGPRDAEAARRWFAERYPGEKPLNHKIAAAVLELHRRRPMGKFVLGLGAPGNDCSDFTAACVDHGLGVGARFDRGSAEHLLGERMSLYEEIDWRTGVVVQPGDQVSVRHSPWYPPNDKACWHVGIVGSDGQVYDFVKLRSWREARYGRHDFAWFVRHSQEPGQVILWRLHWRYRYRVGPLPAP